MHLQPEFAQEVTDILMEDERIVLQLGRAEHFSKYKKKLHYRSMKRARKRTKTSTSLVTV
jgi:hypothetical protein